MAVTDPVEVIQATLAPVFLVSGANIFLNFLQARLFRINDRVRAVTKDLEGTPEAAPRRGLLEAHARVLGRRQRLVRNALVLGVGTVLLTMLTTILLIVPAIASVPIPGVATVAVFASALVAFAAALLLALDDTFLSVRYTDPEAFR